MSGIQARRADDGNVLIEATAPGGTVKLRVTPEYARRIAAQLIASSQPSQSRSDFDDFGKMLDNLFRGRRR
jgi:hypothetical protein